MLQEATHQLHQLSMEQNGVALDLQLENRSRSSTWPLPDPNLTPEGDEAAIKRDASESPIPPKQVEPPKKMRNAWGNMSYADLITQAILSSQDKRLTLSEIYDWIVQNVPYFADKASSPSTAGWKNSVRHNLSLHSRFVKVQNESSGKSSWWTVNLDAKSTRGRRRSSSVDNGNNPSPKAKKKDRKRHLKKVKVTASSSDICTSSPCDSPTTTGFLQAPWSPSPLIDTCPSPASSDRSATYSPVPYSPVLQRSRNVTPVSPLVSPPALDQQNESVFSGSNSSLLDSFQEVGGHTDISSDSASQQCIDSLASLNLRSSRDGMGSSSSLSSLNSPRLQQAVKTPHHVFNFAVPTFEGSSGYSSVSDTDNVQPPDTLPVHPPTYEDHISQTSPVGMRTACYTPTRHSVHQLCFSIAADQAQRPRSGSEPASMHIHHMQHHHMHQFPPDIDTTLITNTGEFSDLNIDAIIQQEQQYGDFPMSGMASTILPHMTPPQPMPNDPTLTSAALDSPLQVQRQMNTAGW